MWVEESKNDSKAPGQKHEKRDESDVTPPPGAKRAKKPDMQASGEKGKNHSHQKIHEKNDRNLKKRRVCRPPSSLTPLPTSLISTAAKR